MNCGTLVGFVDVVIQVVHCAAKDAITNRFDGCSTRGASLITPLH